MPTVADPGLSNKVHKTSTKQAQHKHTTEPIFVVKRRTGPPTKGLKIDVPKCGRNFRPPWLLMIMPGVAAPGLETLDERRAPESRLPIGMTPIYGRLRDDWWTIRGRLAEHLRLAEVSGGASLIN